MNAIDPATFLASLSDEAKKHYRSELLKKAAEIARSTDKPIVGFECILAVTGEVYVRVKGVLIQHEQPGVGVSVSECWQLDANEYLDHYLQINQSGDSSIPDCLHG